MPLTPVDNDPFAKQTGGLTPVDHDPFATTSTAMPAAMTYDAPDPNAGVGSKILSLIHNAAVGGNLWGRKFQDAATMGGLDAAQGLLPGQDRASAPQTDEAGRQIGPIGSATADIAGYAMGPGKAGVGEGVAKLLGGGWKILPRVAGSAVEGGVTAGASGLLHGEDLKTGWQRRAAKRGRRWGARLRPAWGWWSEAKHLRRPPTWRRSPRASMRPCPPDSIDRADVGNTDGSASTTANLLGQGFEANMGETLGSKIADINRIIAKQWVGLGRRHRQLPAISLK